MACYMGRFRLLLILMLVAAVDLGSPVLPQAAEAAEEFEEATHARRRVLRLVHAAGPRPRRRAQGRAGGPAPRASSPLGAPHARPEAAAAPARVRVRLRRPLALRVRARSLR